MPDNWRPTATWQNMRLRAELLARTRAFFHDRDFLEVETPLLSADTVVDRHLDPIAVGSGWLQTSPELAMKRLLAASGESIYQITRAFRGGEQGRLHNREFTIVEWYRPGDTMEDGIGLLSDLCEALLNAGPADRIRYRDAVLQHTELDPLTADTAQFPPGIADDRDDWLDLFMVDLVMPNLGRDRPVIVYDYPASQAALAKIRDDDPPVAERFELFYRGVELANGYHELLDANELRRRSATANRQRLEGGKQALPEDNRLLAAMEFGLPPCTGVALGFDRLVMLAAGASSLAEVIAFPADRA